MPVTVVLFGNPFLVTAVQTNKSSLRHGDMTEQGDLLTSEATVTETLFNTGKCCHLLLRLQCNSQQGLRKGV